MWDFLSPVVDPALQLVRRHEGHSHTHYANLKYGYIVFGLSFVFISLISLRNSLAIKGSFRKTFTRKFPLPVAVAFWGIFVGSFCIIGVHNFEYLTLAKRTGRITYSILPLVVFLALRPSPLPNVSYLETLQLHKWISRIIVLTGFLHGSGYFIHYVKTSNMSRLFLLNNFLGFSTLIFFLVMAVTSLKPLRRRFYNVFYYIHYSLAWLSTIFIIFHARPGVYILAFWAILILVAQIAYRFFAQTLVSNVKVVQVAPTLMLVTLPRRSMPTYFSMGSHIRVSLPLSNFRAWINPTHPYTVASLPEDSEVRLLVREAKFKINYGSKLSITGPYPSVASDIFAKANRVLIVAGGSGLSYGASVYRGLEERGVSVKLIWMVRTNAEVSALGLLEVNKADVYITGGETHSRLAKGNTDVGSLDDIELNELLDDVDQGLDDVDDGTIVSSAPSASGNSLMFGQSDNEEENDDMIPSRENSNNTLVSGELTDRSKYEGGLKGIKILNRSPDLEVVLSEYFDESSTWQGDEEDDLVVNNSSALIRGNDFGSNWVISCGPEGLVDKTRNLVKRRKNLEFFGEKYAM